MPARRTAAFLRLTGLFLGPYAAFPHGGGVDSNGGHVNRQTGEYHCHRDSCQQPGVEPPTEESRPKRATRTLSAPGITPNPATVTHGPPPSPAKPKRPTGTPAARAPTHTSGCAQDIGRTWSERRMRPKLPKSE